MRSSILFLALFSILPAFPQYQLPPTQLLADSGIKEIKIFYEDVGYYHWGDSVPISLEDTGEKYMAYRVKLDEHGRMVEEDYFNGSYQIYHKVIRYSNSGEVVLDSVQSNNLGSFYGFLRLREQEDGGWLYERVTYDGHREVALADSARTIKRKVFYWNWGDSLVMEQFFNLNLRRESYFKGGELTRIKEWKWILKDGKPVQFIISKNQVIADKNGRSGVTVEEFEVLENGKLKITQQEEETIFNTTYFKINFHERFLILEPINRRSIHRHDKGLMPYSMTMNVPSFDMATRRYRYRFEYIK